MEFPAAPALRSWVTRPCLYIAFGFKATERGIDAADRRLPVYSLRDVILDRDTITVGVQGEGRHKHLLFQSGDVHCSPHFFAFIEVIVIQVPECKRVSEGRSPFNSSWHFVRLQTGSAAAPPPASLESEVEVTN
jgi:hypothetical protein